MGPGNGQCPDREGIRMTSSADAIVVGAGLAGLVAAHELTAAGRRVALVDQEGPADLGGQAYWSLGGLFLVDSPEQRRLRVEDSLELAWSDWQGSAQFDRVEDQDSWAVQWARAYVQWAAGEKRAWLRGHGISLLPIVGWAERGGLRAGGHGNSVPRFHIAWGTGTGVVEPFVRYAHEAAARGLLTFHHRHRVDQLVLTDGAVTGVRGTVLAPDDTPRGAASNRDPVGEFELTGRAVILATGGIGGDHDVVRRYWPAASAPRRARWSPASRRTSTGGCWTSRPRPARTWSTVTGCGTTPRACRTGTRSGPGTASGSCPARPRCGSTRSAAGCPTPACPATTPWPPCSTCAPRRTSRRTTTPGSCSPARSWPRSSRCPGRSRIPTSPPGTSAPCSASGCWAGARRPRCRRSSTTEPISSPPARSSSWSSG